MIATIDNRDVDIYLEKEEVEGLEGRTLEGVFIKFKRPKLQGVLTVQIKDTVISLAYGVELDAKEYWDKEEGFRVDAFIAKGMYQHLREKGVIGIRSNMRDGAKVHIYDRSKISIMENHVAKNLEYYRDNKDQLPENVYG